MMASAPPSNLYDDEAAMLEHYRQEHMARTSISMSTGVEDDALYAQRLQQEEQDQQYARDMEEQLRRDAHVVSFASPTQLVAGDEAVAHDMAQQLHDEDVARQYALAEERALAARMAEAAAQPATPTCRRRLLTQGVPCLCLLGGAVAVYVVLRSMGNADVIAIPGLGTGPFLSDSDPFDGLDPSQVARWYTGETKRGLTLTIVNALDQNWQDVFPLVVSDWDNGVPDALSLTVEQAAPDFECVLIEGKSKVCNGDYGDTQWKGINLAMIERNYIVGSTSKMNEFYLNGATTEQKRYTLCHETGHSFGLPHTDEDFYNKDLGNCMDYTANPGANQSPDGTNYAFLQDLYGTVVPISNRHLDATTPNTTTKIPHHLRARLQDLLPAMENHPVDNAHTPPQGWRLLHTSQHGQAHELDLGDGWTVQIHILTT